MESFTGRTANVTGAARGIGAVARLLAQRGALVVVADINGVTPAGIEAHSIDVIPDSERRGRVRSQFTLWFATNANVFNFVLGGFAILFGLNLFWALVALFTGTLLGMVFTALHAVQGPRLGVPQMIQSRGQFGFCGAILIFLASILLDVGYLAGQQVVQAQSMQDLVGSVSIPVWIIIVTLPAVALAIVGYHWIHRVQPALTLLLGGALLAAMILTATSGRPLGKGMGGTHLSSFPIFIAAVGLFFMNMLSWAVYVSDYSRYLPRNASGPRTFWAVFGGNVIGTCLCAGLGIYITAGSAEFVARVLDRHDRREVDPAHGGADISWLVGFVVAGAGYLVASRLAHDTAVPAGTGIRDTVT